jgi:hypothetical protein
MGPSKRPTKLAAAAKPDGSPPKPFKKAPSSLEPFIRTLSKQHVYITHIDSKPKDFKTKIFLVPIGMNVATVLIFLWRMWYIIPYYNKLVLSGLGHPNDTTFSVADSTWGQLVWEICKRGISIFADFLLFTFVLPEPVEFFFGNKHSNPVRWRWCVGFRDKEIYVRRSREWDKVAGDIFKSTEARQVVLGNISQATSPMLLNDKTGYLTMNSIWALDWEGMVTATALVDKKEIALEAFRTVVLLHHQDYGWLSFDMGTGVNADEDQKRRQVFAFKDALAAVDKEDLFFRWIEIVQFESSQPGGFGPEKQMEAAKKIRDLFQENGIDFDEFWKESVGSDASTGL